MIANYALKLQAGESRVTDFNEGSVIRNLLEAYAVDGYSLREEKNELTRIGFINSSFGEWLDLHGANPFIQISRDTGSESSGFVTFSIPEALDSDVIVPAGTVVTSSEDDLDFSTEADCLISVGETSGTVFVTCLTTGEDGNIETNSIDTIEDGINIPGLTVTNDNKFTGGTDYEEDDEYRERLLNYVRQDDFGSIQYYMRLAESVEGVHDIILVNTNGYTRKVLVNGDVKPVDDTVVSTVLEMLTDLENLVIDHNFTVDKCNYQSVNLTLNLGVVEELEESIIVDTLSAVFDGGMGAGMLEFEGLYISESITNERLTDVLFMIDDINTVEIINTNTGSVLTEITPSNDTVLKLGNVVINQTVNG